MGWVKLMLIMQFLFLFGNVRSQCDSLISEFERTAKVTFNISKLIDISYNLIHYNTDSAYQYAHQILEIGVPYNDYELNCKVLLNLGVIAKTNGKYSESNEYLFKALALAEKGNLLPYKIKCLCHIGDLNRCMGCLDRSLSYLYLSRNLAHINNVSHDYPFLYDRIGSTFFQLAERDYPEFKCSNILYQTEFNLKTGTVSEYLELSKVYADSAIDFSNTLNESITKLSALNLIGAYYRKQNNYDQAIEYFNRAILLAEKVNYLTDIPNYYINIAQTYFNLKQYQTAIQNGLKAYRLATDLNILAYKATSSYILRMSYTEMQDYKNALHYQQVEATTRAEIVSQQNWNKVLELDKKYETAQKQEEIEHQKYMLEMQNAQLFWLHIIIVLLLLVMVLVVLGVIHIKRNSAKMKFAFEKISRQNEELNQINTTKNKLMSVIAHDLRGPIGNIFSGLELVNRRRDEKELVDKFIPRLATQAENAFVLLENLLFWVRNQLQNPDAEMEYQKIFPVFVTNKSLLQKQADEKNIEIKINSDENVMANFDKDMLCIVIRNLLSNAIKFTHNGGIITMSAYIDNNKVFVEIADTGIGFDKENLAKINDSSTYFTSLGTNAEKGTGLGLKICKELVEKNRGMLLMRKNSPKGTVIYFNLLAPKE